MAQENEVEIYRDGEREFSGEVCLCAPVEALDRPGLIRILGIEGQEGKHRTFMLSQRALIDFEEGALEVTRVSSGEPIEVRHGDQVIHVDRGCVLAMDTDQNLCFLIHEGISPKRMLSIFNRAATRLIRLDVP